MNHFAPKMLSFSYVGMCSRARIAALHYNENSRLDQKINTDGEKSYGVRYPKYKFGHHVVTKVYVECTYDYVDSLMRKVYELCLDPRNNQNVVEIPPPLCDAFDQPDKATAVLNHMTR